MSLEKITLQFNSAIQTVDPNGSMLRCIGSNNIGLEFKGKLFGVLPRWEDLGTHDNSNVERQYFQWTDNQLYYVVLERSWTGTGTHTICIRKANGNTLIGTVESGNVLCFGPSMIVRNNICYVFYTGPNAVQNSLRYRTSTDLVTWSAPVTAFTETIATARCWNTSVTYNTTTSQWIVALERNDTTVSGGGFWVDTIGSYDGITWARYGDMRVGPYAACPTIRYNAAANKFYFMYLQDIGSGNPRYVTRLASLGPTCTAASLDFSAKPFVVSSGVDGTNGSDVDFCEVTDPQTGLKLVLVNWGNGDQVSWGEVRLWAFHGSLVDLYAYFDYLITTF